MPQHECYAEGCDRKVPPEMLMCKRHWFKVPYEIRQRVWHTWRLDPYSDAAQEAREAARDSLKRPS